VYARLVPSYALLQMRVYTDIEELAGSDERFAVTIGSYDGVHLGHRKVLSELTELAGELDALSVVITFDPHPRCVVEGGACPPSLISREHKLGLIEAAGIDICLVLPFDEELRRLDAGEFITGCLCSRMHIVAVCVGSDFVFGRGRGGCVTMLKSLGEELGFMVRCVPPVTVEGSIVSSTAIRDDILSGRIESASRLLGRPYSILGTIVPGRAIGRKLGYPTANVDPHHEAIPPEGVYAVKAVVRGNPYRALLYIGRRPTFGGGEVGIEVYLMDFSDMIYGEDIEVTFLSKIRGDMKFGSAGELVERIREDRRAAEGILGEKPGAGTSHI
jgi:riboflavin kinase / FMN adenylyltransferase